MRHLRLHLSLCLALSAPAFTAQAASAPWIPFGPDGGDARSFAPDPKDHSHLFAGAADGWIYETHDFGGQWKRLARVGKRDDLVLDSIVIDPTNSKHLVLGAFVLGSSDGGIFDSNDSGKTWTIQPEMKGQSVRSLAVAASDPKIMIAGSLKGVFRSTDSGAHWKPISPADSTEIHEVESIAIDPKDPNTIYAGTWHLPWKTTDGGTTWTNMKQGIIDDSDVFSIIVDPQTPQTIFASACSGIYKSDDAGTQFHKVQGIPATARRTRVLLQDPDHRETVYAGTTEGLWRSDDAGKLWKRTTGPEIIVNDVVIDAKDSHHILIATDRGGILTSNNNGDSFQPANAGFSSRQITSLHRDTQHPNTLYAGVVNDKEWGGVFQSENGGLNWTQRASGLEGRDVFSIGQAADGTVIAGTNHGIYRLTGSTWARATATSNTPAAAEAPHTAAVATRPEVPVGRNQFSKKTGVPTASESKAQAHPAHKATSTHRATKPAVAKAAPAIPFDGSVYAFTNVNQTLLATTSAGLLASTDNGATWAQSGPAESTQWRFLAASKDHVLAAALHTLHLSSDSGATWTNVSLPTDFSQVSSIAIDNAGELWVAGREGVLVSSNAGASWATPKNLFTNSVNNLFYDEATNRLLVTTASASSTIFTVQLPGKEISYASTGWDLRLTRPVGDHLVGVTLFDGVVVQPRMVDTPFAGSQPAAQSGGPAASAQPVPPPFAPPAAVDSLKPAVQTVPGFPASKPTPSAAPQQD